VRVLHVINWTGVGGSEEQCLTLARHLEGCVNGFVYFEQGGLQAFFEEAGQTFHLGVTKQRPCSFDYVGFDRVFSAFRPDVVHVHVPGGVNPNYLRNVRSPVVVTVLCPRLNLIPRRSNRRFIGPSNFVNLVNGGSLKVVPYGFDVERHAVRVDWREKLGIPKEAFVVSRVSSLDPVKRFEDFFKVAEQLLGSGEDIYFLSAGLTKWDSKNQRSIGARIQDEYSGRFWFYPDLPAEEKMNLWGAGSVALQPTCWEAFGCVFLEAMSCGLPVITYNDGANAEVVGDAGVILGVGDLKGLKEHVLRLYRNVEDLEELSARAVSRVRDSFSPVAFASRVKAIYGEVVR